MLSRLFVASALLLAASPADADWVRQSGGTGGPFYMAVSAPDRDNVFASGMTVNISPTSSVMMTGKRRDEISLLIRRILAWLSCRADQHDFAHLVESR